MKSLSRILSKLVILTAIAAMPIQATAENYSSEYTRKWAAQRAAEQERARQREAQRLEKQHRRQELDKAMTRILNIEEGLGGSDINSEPIKRRRPRQAPPVSTLPPQPIGNGAYGGGRNELPRDTDMPPNIFGATFE